MSPAKMIFLFLGILSFVVGLKALFRNRQSRNWPTAPGEILESEVTGFDEDFISVKYRYTVKGREFRGDKFRLSGFSDSRAPEIIKNYPPGTRVEVLYDPDNPATSALEPDPPVGPVVFMVGGLLFIAFSCFVSF